MQSHLQGTLPVLKTGRPLGKVVNIFIPALGRLSWEESEATLAYVLRLSQRGKGGTRSPGLMVAAT